MLEKRQTVTVEELLRRLIEQQTETNRHLAVMRAHMAGPKRVIVDGNGEVVGVEQGEPVRRKRPPKAAVAALKRDPKNLAREVVKKYGEGSAAVLLRDI